MLRLLAALLHWFSLFYCITSTACGVLQLPVAAIMMPNMLLGLPNYKDWANWRPAVCLLVPLSR